MVPLGNAVIVLVPTGNPPSLRFGHPDVTYGRHRPSARTSPEPRVAIPAGSDIRVPTRTLSAAKQGEAERPGAVGAPAGAEEGYSVPPSPCRNEDEYRFPCGAKHPRSFQAELHVSPRVVRPGGFTFSRFRRQSLPRCRSPPQPSAHEYAAPYPAPSPPGTRPRGESPWGQRRGRYRRTAP